MKQIKILFVFMIFNIPFSNGNELLGQDLQTKSVSDFELMLDWFTGEFNNYEQNAEEVYAKEKEGKNIEPHYHMHSIFAPIKFTDLGEHIFHVQQSNGVDLDKIFRQRIYKFTENEDNEIELRIYKYINKDKFKNIHKNDSLQNLLTLNDIEETGCVVLWEKDGNKFVAKNEDGFCKTFSSYFKKNIIVKDNITLTKDQIWISDSIYDESDSLIMGRKDGIPSKSKKCSFYKGWAAIENTDSTISDTTSKSKYVGYYGLEIHNQGQHARLIVKDGTEADHEVSLSQLTYSGSNVKVLKLGLHKRGEKSKTVSYIWGEPTAPRLGMNLKWIQTGFTLIEGQRFSK